MNILDILVKQETVLTELLLEMEKEKRALIAGDADALFEVVEKKTSLVQQMEFLDKERMDNFGPVAIVEIEIEKELKDQVIEKAAQMKKMCLEMKNLQETNFILTQQSMDYQIMMLNAIKSSIQKTGVYGQDGKMDSSAVNSALNRSI